MSLAPRRSSICLNMIVRDEAHCIERCLESCKPVIKFVRICDTGSTDHTPDIIQKWCRKNKIDCKIISRPWVDFAHNRNEALQLAGECPATHLLLIDADEVLHINDFQAGVLEKKLAESDNVLFTIPMVTGENVSTRTNLVRNLPGRLAYKYAIHEELVLDGDPDIPLTMIANPVNYRQGPHCTTPQDGARSQRSDRLLRDIQTLMQCYLLDKDPRHLFYAAQTLRVQAHAFGKEEDWLTVKDTYLKYLAETEGQKHPHRLVAALWAARIFEMEGNPPDQVIREYLKVWEMDPGRPEAMGCLALFCFEQGFYGIAEDFARRVETCRGSSNFGFLETKWYGKAESILEKIKGREVVA